MLNIIGTFDEQQTSFFKTPILNLVPPHRHLVLASYCFCSSHDNRTGRWLTGFRAAWDPKNDNTFVIGNMGRPRKVCDYYFFGFVSW